MIFSRLSNSEKISAHETVGIIWLFVDCILYRSLYFTRKLETVDKRLRFIYKYEAYWPLLQVSTHYMTILCCISRTYNNCVPVPDGKALHALQYGTFVRLIC
jgi:hypothetical protein